MTDKNDPDAPFRPDIAGKAADGFEEANPRYLTQGYDDPSVFKTIADINEQSARDKVDFDRAAYESKTHRTATEALKIFEERMQLNHSPRPPSFADHGRGGMFDPRTIYEQARQRIDLADESYRRELDEQREAAKAQTLEHRRIKDHGTNTDHAEEEYDMTKYSPVDELRDDIFQVIEKSHAHRTELNLWYFNNRTAIIEELRSKGFSDPEETAMEAQRRRIAEVPVTAQQAIQERLDQFDKSVSRGPKNMPEADGSTAPSAPQFKPTSAPENRAAHKVKDVGEPVIEFQRTVKPNGYDSGR